VEYTDDVYAIAALDQIGDTIVPVEKYTMIESAEPSLRWK
jgi:hypothetical protein